MSGWRGARRQKPRSGVESRRGEIDRVRTTTRLLFLLVFADSRAVRRLDELLLLKYYK